MHWKLTLSYDGAAFHGWQVQPGLPTVQGTLAAALERLTGEQVLPQGSGRTDAGVHALAQVASVSLRVRLPASNLRRALNHVLPPSVRVLAAEEVPPAFHARHSARAKTYEYRIFEERGPALPFHSSENSSEGICSPFLAPYLWACRWKLDLPALQAAAAVLTGTQDWTSFAAVDPARRERVESTDPVSSLANPDTSLAINPVKTIYSGGWERRPDALIYRVTGSGFLHHMVRNFVGTMIEVGRGSLTLGDLRAIVAKHDRSAAGPTAPAHGLYLVCVHYNETLSSRSHTETVIPEPYA